MCVRLAPQCWPTLVRAMQATYAASAPHSAKQQLHPTQSDGSTVVGARFLHPQVSRGERSLGATSATQLRAVSPMVNNTRTVSTVDGLTTTSGARYTSESTVESLMATVPPGEARGRGGRRKCDDVEDALDELRAEDVPFFNKYTVLGAVERRTGGQSLVQFLRGTHNGANYAAKVRASPATARSLRTCTCAVATRARCAVLHKPRCVRRGAGAVL